MRKKSIKTFLFLIFLFTAQSIWSQAQYMDVLFLKDGSSFKGLIIEQIPGSTIKLQSLNGSILTFKAEEIERIVKEERTERELTIRYIDVVFLKDGVIFRGVIVEQMLGESIKLETMNNALIIFALDDIWKIAKEKRIEGQESEGEEDRIETIKRELRLQIAGREKPGLEKVAEGEEKEERLEEEIEKLKEEMEEEPEARVAGEELEDLKEIKGTLQQMMEELMEIAKGMWTEEQVEGSEDNRVEIERVKEELQALVGEIMDLGIGIMSGEQAAEVDEARRDFTAIKADLESLSGEIRELSRAKKMEDREATQFVLEKMLEDDGWKNPDNWAAMDQMVSSLPREDRQALYEAHKRRDTLLSTGLNLIPALGIGSWVQGDIPGALIGNSLFFGGAVCAALYWMQPGMDESTFYAGLVIMGTSYTWSIIRPFLYEIGQNSKIRNTLGLSAARVERREQFTILGRTYLLLNLGGFLFIGPGAEVGLQFLPETFIAVRAYYPTLGLVWNYTWTDGFQSRILSSYAVGTSVIHFFKSKRSNNRIYICGSIEYMPVVTINYPGTIFENTYRDNNINIYPGVGYRVRLPHRFFLSCGMSVGIRICQEFSEMGKEVYIDPHGCVELSVGKEFF